MRHLDRIGRYAAAGGVNHATDELAVRNGGRDCPSGSTDRNGSPSRNHQGTPFSIGRISVSGEIIGLANRAASASAGALTAIREMLWPKISGSFATRNFVTEKHYSRGWRVRAVAP